MCKKYPRFPLTVFLLDIAGNELNVDWTKYEDFATITWRFSHIGAPVHFRDESTVSIAGAFQSIFEPIGNPIISEHVIAARE